MATPIYKMYLISRPTEAWYQLSQAEQEELAGKVREVLEKVGGKPVVRCQAGWCGDQWFGFGVEEFPDIAAVQRQSELLNELNWFRYLETTSVLGTKSG